MYTRERVEEIPIAEQTNHSEPKNVDGTQKKNGKWKRYSNGNGCLCAAGVLKYLKKIKSKKVVIIK